MRRWSCTLATLLGLASFAHGDDTLHDGAAASLGGRSDTSLVTHLKADVGIVPYPGGDSVWGGPINATRAELTLTTTSSGVAFEQGRLEVVRWPHLHALGVDRDTRVGNAIGGELVGLYVPVPLWGDIGAREWSIVTVGADLGYRHQLTHAGARHAGEVGYSTALCELALQHQLSDRVQLRTTAVAEYTLGVGKLVGIAGGAAEQLVELAGAVSLYYDFTSRPPVRRVPRTDPATAEVTYTTVANEGKRWRLTLVEISGSVRPFDSISTARAVAMINTGVSREY